MEFNREDLDPAEQKLVDAVEAGTVYGPETGDIDSWPVIRAEVIRNLLRGAYQDVVPDPHGLRLRRVRIDRRIDLDYIDTRSPLILYQCDLPGGLTAAHARLPALRLYEMTIDRTSTDQAVIHLVGLKVGVLELVRSALINEQGPALMADGVAVGSSMVLDEVYATGHSGLGAARFPGATIGRRLSLRGARLVNRVGAALIADGITVGSDAYVDFGFTCSGPAGGGSVRLPEATIGGSLLLCVNLTKTDCEKEGSMIVLEGTHVASHLYISSTTLTHESMVGRCEIDGLTYRHLKVDADPWLEFVRKGSDEYSPQPYQQLAAVARARGDEKLTRKALIAQHDDLLARSRDERDLLTGRQRAALWALKYTVGYGYRTWRALGWLALTVGLAVITAFTFGSADWLWGWGWDWAAAALQQPADSMAGSPGAPCRPVDLVVLGLETIPLIPLISGGADRCFVTSTAAGTVFLGISVGLKIAAWAMAALFVAGYTSIVRNPGP